MLANSFSYLFFLKSSKDLKTKMYEGLQKNEIWRRSYVLILIKLINDNLFNLKTIKLITDHRCMHLFPVVNLIVFKIK
jgi:hypothetical protein